LLSEKEDRNLSQAGRSCPQRRYQMPEVQLPGPGLRIDACQPGLPQKPPRVLRSFCKSDQCRGCWSHRIDSLASRPSLICLGLRQSRGFCSSLKSSMAREIRRDLLLLLDGFQKFLEGRVVANRIKLRICFERRSVAEPLLNGFTQRINRAPLVTSQRVCTRKVVPYAPVVRHHFRVGLEARRREIVLLREQKHSGLLER